MKTCVLFPLLVKMNFKNEQLMQFVNITIWIYFAVFNG